LNEMQMLCI